MVVLSKRLAKLAKRARAAAVRLTAPEAEAVAQLLHERPDLKGKLDTRTAYRVPAKEGNWLTVPPRPTSQSRSFFSSTLRRMGARDPWWCGTTRTSWPAGSRFS